MPKGNCYSYLFDNSDSGKPIENVWSDIQDYTGEIFPEDIQINRNIDFIIVFPPLMYKGKFIKGLYMSQGVDYLHTIYPEHNKLFIPMAYTMWSSLPWSEYADAYLSCYNNLQRERWFKETYPQKANKIIIGTQDADFTHEYAIAPIKNINKDIDVLSIGRLDAGKNLPLLIKALKIYEQKYGIILKATIILGKKEQELTVDEKKVLDEMISVAGDLETLKKYVTLIDYVNYGLDLSVYYNRAKCVALTSVFEGKNRSINEALSCDVPVVIFRDLCKYTKGEDEVIPENCGVYAEEFSAESFADALYKTLTNTDKFTPRYQYLKHFGRINFVNKCIDAIPYYRENIPEYEAGKIHENIWVDLATQINYGLSFNDYVYGRNLSIQHSRHIEHERQFIEYYMKKFQSQI